MALTLRYMQLPDIPQVVTIDKLAFDPPWSARSYAYEVGESHYSHMVVLERSADEKPVHGLRRLVQNLGGTQPPERQIVAYGGLWHIMDEAHISTIATHPDWRGRGYGEIVLAGMVRRGLTLGAAYIVLEVRVSNHTAQRLYQKYDFQTVDTKRKYYHNNGEDAYDMRLFLSENGARERFEQHFTDVQARVPFIDQYTAVPHPRPSSNGS